MAAYFRTTTPQALLNKFDAAIHQTQVAGKVTTWEKNHQGYYTHRAADWRAKAFFKATVSAGVLVFNIIRPSGKTVTKVAYGYYHGHLIETFLNHFDDLFSGAEATAHVAVGDVVAA